MTAPSKRRWFRFSLRTMIEIALIAALFAVAFIVPAVPGWGPYNAGEAIAALSLLDIAIAFIARRRLR